MIFGLTRLPTVWVEVGRVTEDVGCHVMVTIPSSAPCAALGSVGRYPEEAKVLQGMLTAPGPWSRLVYGLEEKTLQIAAHGGARLSAHGMVPLIFGTTCRG